MTTLANHLTLLGIALIRFGGQIGGRIGGFAFTLFGLVIVGLVVWALTRPAANESTKDRS